MSAQIHVGMSGEYRLIIKRGDGTEEDTGWFKNLILNTGLDKLGNGDQSGPGFESVYQWCKVGTGSTTPAVTDISLENQLGSATYFEAVRTNSGAPNYKAQHVIRYDFGIGQIIGNIAEIGVGWTSGNGTLFSRALLLDGSGNPTTISLTSFDQLRAYYRLNFAPSTDTSVGSITLGSTTYGYSLLHQSIGTFDPPPYGFAFAGYGADMPAYGGPYTLGAITGTPSGGIFAGLQSGRSAATYISGNYYLDVTMTFGAGVGNVPGGLTGFNFNVSGSENSYQIAFDTPIPKDDTKTFTITIRNSWGRL